MFKSPKRETERDNNNKKPTEEKKMAGLHPNMPIITLNI